MRSENLARIAVSVVIAGTGIARADGPGASVELTPYLDIRFEQAMPSVDVGLEWRPSSALRLKPSILVARPDSDKATGELSQERKGIGSNLEINLGRGWGINEYSRGTTWSIGGEVGWNVENFEFNPAGGKRQSVLSSSWVAGVNFWLFTSIGRGEGSPGAVPQDVVGTAPVSDTFDWWPVQPQLSLKLARESEASAERLVVRPPDADGSQFAERLRLEGPEVIPSVSARLALAFSPPRGSRMAFAPVYKFTTKGDAGARQPWGSAARMRLEGWIYFFVFDDGERAVRVGTAPFIDWRSQGTDTRENFISGVLLEVRSGTKRLEY